MTRPLLLVCFAALLAACSDASSPDASSGDVGPALSVTERDLDGALTCSGALAAITQDAVLLTPAFSTDEESFGWNYLPQLRALGIPHCSLSLPDGGFGDLQHAAEYVVLAVRRMSAQSKRKVILFGHQHGPLDELWALMFWPDLREKVSSLISLATPYQGTTTAAGTCQSFGRCPPSVWQIAQGSQFLAALNARALPAGPAYTSITTLFDELITPQPEASRRDGATNLVLQDICPGRLAEHFTILSDHLAYQLVLDAITHPGEPADPARLPADVCTGPLTMPSTTNPQSAVAALQGLTGFITGFTLAVGIDSVEAEPALREYAR